MGSVDSRDASGKTPLITVCGTKASNYNIGHLKIVEKLLACGADPLAADSKGHTRQDRGATSKGRPDGAVPQASRCQRQQQTELDWQDSSDVCGRKQTRGDGVPHA